MKDRCNSKSTANSKKLLFAGIFDFADTLKITFEAAPYP
jgi:hypothetical protein